MSESSKYQTGSAALAALNQGEGSKNEFTSFTSGTSRHVKVLGTEDLISFFSYGIYQVVNSFVAEKPSKKSDAGYPTADYTPWDKAWKYHKDLSDDWQDDHGKEASKYRPKQRFAMGFFDLETGELIVIDVSKNQAQVLHGAIVKYEKRLGEMAFELSKQGSGQNTVVSLAPVMFPDEDLSSAEKRNLEKTPEEFDMTKFDGILFEADEDQQILSLIEAGFDIVAIGLEKPVEKDAEEGSVEKDAEEGPVEGEQDDDIEDDDLPF